MQKIIFMVGGIVLGTTLSPSIHTTGVLAAECEIFQTKIGQERNFIKRRALLHQAVEKCSQDAPLRYQYARELERSRKYDQALEQYQQVLLLDPTMVQVYSNMGDIYRSQQKFTQALSAYQMAIELDPDNSRVQKNMEAVRQSVQE